MKKISIKDIARMTGTSPTTVSFVLNGKGRTSDALTKKILATAKKEGYQPNQIAVSLRTGQSKVIGLIVENMGGSFFGAVSKELESEAKKYGYRIVYCSSENNIRKGREMMEMLAHQQVDGYIITPTAGLEKDVMKLITSKKPVVLMDSYYPGLDIPYVLVDNFNGIKQGIDYLIEAGYENIGFVTVDLDLIQMKERLSGYTETLKFRNIKPDKKLVLTLQYDSTKEEMVNEITSFIKKNKNMDAIFFATNYLGIAGLQSLSNIRYKVPEDIAMISFDDHEIFSLFAPGITTIQQPTEEIARAAMNLLLTQLGKKESNLITNKIQIPANLVKRNSVKKGKG